MDYRLWSNRSRCWYLLSNEVSNASGAQMMQGNQHKWGKSRFLTFEGRSLPQKSSKKVAADYIRRSSRPSVQIALSQDCSGINRRIGSGSSGSSSSTISVGTRAGARTGSIVEWGRDVRCAGGL